MGWQSDIKNMDDGIYAGASTDGLVQSSTGKHLMLSVVKKGQGYVGSFNVGVDAIKT